MEPKVVINARVVEGWENINEILLKNIDEFKTELGKIAIENNSTQINEHVSRINLVVQELEQFRMKVNKLNEEGKLDKSVSIEEQEKVYQNMVNLLQEIKKECELYRERKSNQNSTSPQDSQVQFTEVVNLFDQIQDKFDIFVRQNHGTAKKLLPLVLVDYEVKQQEPFAKMQWIMKDRWHQRQHPAEYKAEREAREREVKAYNQAKEQHKHQMSMRKELKSRIEVEQKRFDSVSSVSSDTSPKSPTLLERIGNFLLRRSKKESQDLDNEYHRNIEKIRGSNLPRDFKESMISGLNEEKGRILKESKVLPKTSNRLFRLGILGLVAGIALAVAGMVVPPLAPILLSIGISLMAVGSGLLVSRSAAIKLAKDAEVREAEAIKESEVTPKNEEESTHSSDGFAMQRMDAQGLARGGPAPSSNDAPTVGQVQHSEHSDHSIKPKGVQADRGEATPMKPQVRFDASTKGGEGVPGEDSHKTIFRR